VTDQPTRLLNQLLALTDDPDDIDFTAKHGQPLLILGCVHVALGQSSQAALDKLAVAAAQAAADSRARRLREVA